MTISRNPETFDFLVIGARCAGAATAMLLARAGARVLIVDRAPEIGDTLSTHAMMRPGVAMLARHGLLDLLLRQGTPVVNRTRFFYGKEVTDIPIPPTEHLPGLIAPRRQVLDRTLCAAAIADGAELRLATAFESLVRDDTGRVTGAVLRGERGQNYEVRASLVIGADGRASAVARAADATERMRDGNALATVYGYFEGVANEGYRWHFGDEITGGVIPTNEGNHLIFTSCRPSEFTSRFGFDALAGMTQAYGVLDPEIAATLRDTRPVERLRRYPGADGVIRACTGCGWALVGDAGYFKDPATAHGLTDALLDAERLAEAALTDPSDVSVYQVARDSHATTIFALTQRIASLDWTFGDLRALHLRFVEAMRVETPELPQLERVA
jgi:menaquinone-9 beta-reductase